MPSKAVGAKLGALSAVFSPFGCYRLCNLQGVFFKSLFYNVTWCTGKTQRDRVEREVGGGIGMGNTCKSMADSCQCMTKTTTIL